MRHIVMKPSERPESLNQPWALVWRTHDLGGADYDIICYFDDDGAREFMEEIETHRPHWLFEPDWGKREKLRSLEKARQLEEEAKKIREGNKL